MKGLDTNMLVRYLVKDDEKQAKKAAEYIKNTTEKGESCFINNIVLCELVWVLDSAYGYSKAEIAEVVEKLLNIRQFEIESKDVARKAIQDYIHGSGDLADYLIGRTNALNGCEITFTFDLTLKSNPLFLAL